jgi:hypothetical protein
MLKALRRAGFEESHIRGSHHYLRHPQLDQLVGQLGQSPDDRRMRRHPLGPALSESVDPSTDPATGVLRYRTGGHDTAGRGSSAICCTWVCRAGPRIPVPAGPRCAAPIGLVSDSGPPGTRSASSWRNSHQHPASRTARSQVLIEKTSPLQAVCDMPKGSS